MEEPKKVLLEIGLYQEVEYRYPDGLVRIFTKNAKAYEARSQAGIWEVVGPGKEKFKPSDTGCQVRLDSTEVKILIDAINRFNQNR